MNRILGIVAGVVVLGLSASTVAAAPQAFVLPACLQDQYGNQYTQLVQDVKHNIVTGTVNEVQCNIPWTMVGSWTVSSSGQTILELSVANNSGSTTCVPIYKLKGPYPEANWFYDTGFGNNQPFKYAVCSEDSPRLPDTGVGGAYGVKQ